MITRQRLPRITGKLAILFLVIFGLAPSANAQFQRARVRLNFSQPNLARITIRPQQPLLTWSFLNSYGGALGLGDRVQNLQEDSDGDPVAIKRIAAGVFRADRPVFAVNYEVRLALRSGTNAAHVSWLTPDGGVLMLADLLPLEVMQEGATIDAMFELPEGWEIRPSMQLNRPSMYSLDDPMNAVFTIGPSVKASFKMLNGTRLEVAVSGDWPFHEMKVTEAAAKVLKKYSELTRFRLPNARILIAPMPRSGAETWQAQTRGSTLLLLLDRRASFQNWIAQLKVIFTHELLHLWVPNALHLRGDYDWFFEGFTLYQALLTALDLKAISFNEYLNTIARVYDSYLSSADNLSLIEASEKRWTGAPSAVYDKGMLLAFLYDLELRHETRGESRLSDRYADLFRQYAAKTVNANEAIMSLLISSPGTERLLRSYVEDRQKLELAATLKRYGIVIESAQGGTDLKIVTNPTQDQRRLLKSLGYRR